MHWRLRESPTRRTHRCDLLRRFLPSRPAVAAIAIAGCGGDDCVGGGTAATPEAGGRGGGEAARSRSCCPAASSDQGYNADGKRTADALKKELGADVTFTEAVAIPNQTDVYRQYASQGYDLVIGWGGAVHRRRRRGGRGVPGRQVPGRQRDRQERHEPRVDGHEHRAVGVLRRLRHGQAVQERRGRLGRLVSASRRPRRTCTAIEQGAKYAEPEGQVPRPVHRRLRGPDEGARQPRRR